MCAHTAIVVVISPYNTVREFLKRQSRDGVILVGFYYFGARGEICFHKSDSTYINTNANTHASQISKPNIQRFVGNNTYWLLIYFQWHVVWETDVKVLHNLDQCYVYF